MVSTTQSKTGNAGGSAQSSWLSDSCGRTAESPAAPTSRSCNKVRSAPPPPTPGDPLQVLCFPLPPTSATRGSSVHRNNSFSPGFSTTLEAQSATRDAVLKADSLHSSPRCLSNIRAEVSAAVAPAVGFRVTQMVVRGDDPSSRHRLLPGNHDPAARDRPRRTAYTIFLVLFWFVVNGEERVYKGARRTCLLDSPLELGPYASPPIPLPHYPHERGRVGGRTTCCLRGAETCSSYSVVFPVRQRGRTPVANVVLRPMETASNVSASRCVTCVLTIAVSLAASALVPVANTARSVLAQRFCVPMTLSVATVLFDVGGAEVPAPAGRTAVGRPKGGGVAGPPAPLVAAGTERTGAAPSAAAPAVNDPGGAGGWREKRGDAAKSAGHSNVMVARGAGAATAAAVVAAATSMTTQEEGFARDGHWARSLRRRWGEQGYLDMVARTINGLESEHFWLAMLGKQLQLQSSKMHLKTQRIERHKQEQRRKKQAMAAFNQAQGKAEAAAAEYQRHQRRGAAGVAGGAGAGVSNFFRPGGPGGAGAGPRVITAGQGVGGKNEAELRFGELSLYTLDWVGPRTCAQLGWAAGNDVCALSLEIEIHVLHSRLLLKSVEVQDRQNRLFVCDSGAAFFRASAAALAKQEGSDRQFHGAPGPRTSKKCRGCERGGGASTAGSTTSTTARGRDKGRETKGVAARSPHRATTAVASIGAIPDAPLAFWDDQGGYGDDWTHGGGSRVGATGAAGIGGAKERGTTGVGADRRRGNRPPAGAGAGAGGAPTTASSPSPARAQATAGEKAGKKGQQGPHHGAGADGELKHQHHLVLSSPGEDGTAANGDRGTGGSIKKRRRPNKRKRKIISHNKNVAASLGTLHETFDWETIAHNFYIPALADLQPPGKSMVENFTTELTYLMGVLDREESLRSGKPTAVASSISPDQLRPPFVHGSVPLPGHGLATDRASAERYPGVNFFPGVGGGQALRPSPLDRRRTAVGGIAWAMDSWPRNKAGATVQVALGAGPSPVAPAGTTYQGSAAGSRPQAGNALSFNSPLGRIPESTVKRRPGGSLLEKPGDKGREVAGSLKDKNLFPLVRVTSPSRPFGGLSAPLLDGAVHPIEDQQPQQQTYPWKPAIPRNTRPHQVGSQPDQGNVVRAPVPPAHSAAANKHQGALAEEDIGLRARSTHEAAHDGQQVQTAIANANGGGAALVRNQKWWSQVAVGARGDEGVHQANARLEAEAKVYNEEESKLKLR